jgi:uncharacterized phage-associated protein
MDVQYDEVKFTELLLYVADRLRDDRAGGATKLNKVLYFADFAHVRRTGRPITGAEYQKLGRGPAPRRLLPVRQRLVERGDAEIVREDFLGYKQHRLLPRRRPDLSVFSDDELVTVDKVIADLASLTATQVSDLSHEEPGWQLGNEGETIPYETALVAKRQVSTPTSRRLGADIAQRYDLSVPR